MACTFKRKWDHPPLKWLFPLGFLLHCFGVCSSITVYPDGGRNVIKVLKAKPTRIIPYNDGSVMAHIVGSAGMNFLYYFHILGVSCENNDPEYYKIIQTDFEFCLNKTGPLPPELRNRPLGSVPKACYDWKIHKPCYKNLADDYDECLAGRPGLVKKGTDALRFTHAYFLFVCGNIADTEAHLHDRYTKHDLLVHGVFQCFPKLQDRINNCVKRDKISKTLCSKFFIVHACFGKYYNDDNCHDVQPIYYMDDLFRNMSKSLNCPSDENEWMNGPTPPVSTPYPVGGGWSSREEYSHKENPWPGEMGRPWSSEKGKQPFVRGDGVGVGWKEEKGRNSYQPPRIVYEDSYHQPPRTNQHSYQPPRVVYEDSSYQPPRQPKVNSYQPPRKHHHNSHHNHHHHHQSDRDRDRGGWDSGSRERGWREKLIDPHANRPLPDTSWNRDGNSRPWIDVMERQRGPSTPSYVRPWERGKSLNPNSIESSRGGGRGPVNTYITRGPVRESYVASTPRSGTYKKVALPPAGFAVTRVPQEVTETDQERFYNTRDSSDSDIPMLS